MAIPWSLDADGARPFIERSIEAGINFFDTANVYSDGTSEEIVGRLLADYARRDEIVLATKLCGVMRQGPNGRGLSRKEVMHEIDASLRRLGTDYVDLYQIHRWDPRTPIEETMEALHDVVKAGKARYIGASSMWAWQFSKAQHVAELHGWTKFVSMQNHYNLVYREEEREMLPLCVDQGVGAIPWSPLARGLLTRDPGTSTDRSETDEFGRTLYAKADAGDPRGGREDCGRSRGLAGADRPRLGVQAPCGHRTDRGCHEAPAARGRDRLGRHRAVSGRDHRSRVALHTPVGARLRLTQPEPGGRHAGPLRQHLAVHRRQGR